MVFIECPNPECKKEIYVDSTFCPCCGRNIEQVKLELKQKEENLKKIVALGGFEYIEVLDVLPKDDIVEIDALSLLGDNLPNLAGLVGQIIQGNVVVQDIKNIKNYQYVLDLPKEVVEGLRIGKYEFMKRLDNGKYVANIYEIKDGIKELVLNPVVKEIVTLNPDVMMGIANALQNYAVMKSLEKMSKQLENIGEQIDRLDKGMMDDRVAMIMGARNLIALASETKSEEVKRKNLTDAIQDLTQGVAALQETLKTRVESFTAVPDKKARYLAKQAITRGYKQQVKKSFREIQEYANYINVANTLMAGAYLALDETESAKKVYELSNKYWNSLDLKKIQSIQNLYPKLDFSNEWFMDPIAFDEYRKDAILELADRYRGIYSIKIPGEQVLQAQVG